MEATHACMSMRGVRSTGATTVTVALTGMFDDQAMRAEFLAFAGRSR
jgi:GTP cyclohydrolase I